MKPSFLITLSLFCCVSVFGQRNLGKKTLPIVEEGKMLYRSEMASWHGTDVFIAEYKTPEKIEGYFSYVDGQQTKCIFFAQNPDPVVIGTITFEGNISPDEAILDLSERPLTETEESLRVIRQRALEQLNSDTLYKFYENTNPNLIPLINGKERKVYVLTGPSVGGVVIFGNDYLLTFDKKNRLKSQRALHKNIIPIEYGVGENTEKSGSTSEPTVTMHTHLEETGDFITATDICTLMMYSQYANWKQHYVYTPKYLNIWDCKTQSLTVVRREVIEKINQNLEEENN